MSNPKATKPKATKPKKMYIVHGSKGDVGVVPTGTFCLVEIYPKKDIKKGSIVVAESAQESIDVMGRCRVRAVGPDCKRVKVGDVGCIGQATVYPIMDGPHQRHLLDESGLYAVDHAYGAT